MMALPRLGATIYRIGDSTASLAVKLSERGCQIAGAARKH
jgi:hypothetical protein